MIYADHLAGDGRGGNWRSVGRPAVDLLHRKHLVTVRLPFIALRSGERWLDHREGACRAFQVEGAGWLILALQRGGRWCRA